MDVSELLQGLRQLAQESSDLAVRAQAYAYLKRRVRSGDGLSPVVAELLRTVPRPLCSGAGIYFVRAENGRVKIGQSGDVQARLKELQAASPELLWLEAFVDCSGEEMDELERMFHQRFRASRVHGEWFDPTPELLDCMKDYSCWGLLCRIDQNGQIGMTT